MMLKSDKLLLIFVIVIGIFFRLYNLSSVPPGPTIDEASIGYNSYSILKTGGDEYGSKFPVLLRAFDDWRPALYLYLVIPFVALFDLSVLAVRLPSVILGVLGILGTYFLVKELFPNFKKLSIVPALPAGKNFQFSIAEISALLLAVSPWHVYISRLGHEVNASFTFLILGLLFFFRFINRKSWNLVLSSIFFGLSFDSYQSTKIIVPILLIALSLFFYKPLIKEKFVVVFSAVVGLLVIFPILFNTFDENALIRFKATGILQNSPAYFEEKAKKSIESREKGDLIGLIYNNQKVAGVFLIGNAYISHFNPVWLFSNQGEEPFKAPGIGLLYLVELPLILISFFFLLGRGISKKNIILILTLGLVAIIPASITTGYPHALRAYSILPVPQILSAVGLISLLLYLKKKELQTLLLALFLITISYLAYSFYQSYFIALPKELAHHFQYGAIRAMTEAEKIEKNYDRVVVSNKDRLFESYMFYLYLNKYDPNQYQEMGGTKSGGFAQEHAIENYFFGDVKNKISKIQLYIINPEEKTADMQVIKEIKYPNGELALIIAEAL